MSDENYTVDETQTLEVPPLVTPPVEMPMTEKIDTKKYTKQYIRPGGKGPAGAKVFETKTGRKFYWQEIGKKKSYIMEK